MIICPNCKHEEVDGAIFCSECGSQLIKGENVHTQMIQPEVSDDRVTGPIASRRLSYVSIRRSKRSSAARW